MKVIHLQQMRQCFKDLIKMQRGYFCPKLGLKAIERRPVPVSYWIYSLACVCLIVSGTNIKCGIAVLMPPQRYHWLLAQLFEELIASRIAYKERRVNREPGCWTGFKSRADWCHVDCHSERTKHGNLFGFISFDFLPRSVTPQHKPIFLLCDLMTALCNTAIDVCYLFFGGFHNCISNTF